MRVKKHFWLLFLLRTSKLECFCLKYIIVPFLQVLLEPTSLVKSLNTGGENILGRYFLLYNGKLECFLTQKYPCLVHARKVGAYILS